MKKIVALFFCMVTLALTANAQLLFSISRNDIKGQSFILGSHHFVNNNFLDSIAGFQDAFNEVQQVVGEIDMHGTDITAMQSEIMRQCLLPDTLTLMALFSDKEMEAVDSLALQLIGAKISNPFLANTIGKLTPSFILLLFQGALYEKLYKTENANQKIDTYVQKLAAEKGKHVRGLETLDDQVKLLITDTPLDRQKEMLLCFVQHLDYNISVLQMLTNAYLAMDLDKVQEVAFMQRGDKCDNTEEEQYAMLEGRNKQWMQQMPGIMAEMPTLFVVGAAHLVGDEGLISLLRRNGYAVEPVTLIEKFTKPNN